MGLRKPPNEVAPVGNQARTQGIRIKARRQTMQARLHTQIDNVKKRDRLSEGNGRKGAVWDPQTGCQGWQSPMSVEGKLAPICGKARSRRSRQQSTAANGTPRRRGQLGKMQIKPHGKQGRSEVKLQQITRQKADGKGRRETRPSRWPVGRNPPDEPANTECQREVTD